MADATVKTPAKDALLASSAFTSLTQEWDTLVKAMDADGDGEGDGKKVEAKTDGGEIDPKAGEGGDADDDAFGKSFQVVLDDGTKVDAFDGTQMVKALYADNAALRIELGQVTANSDALLKALTSAGAAVKSQGAMIKALQEDVARIGSQGTGRKAILSVHEKLPAGGHPKQEGVTPKEFMVKAMAAFQAGTITGTEVNMADARLQRGNELPPDLVAKVLGTKT